MQRIGSTPSRTEQVYEMIRDSICDCTLEPGTHLVQEDLAAKLGVSRQPVQQAMLLLKADGLVVETGGRGLYVAPIDASGNIHRYQIRMVLDQLAARLVVGRVADSPDFAAELRARGETILTDGARACEQGDVRTSVAHDVAFHTLLYDMSGNPLISATAEPHWCFLRRVMIEVFLKADRGALVWTQHMEILEALVAGDAGRAHDLLTAHVEGAQTALLGTMSQVGQKQPQAETS